MPLDIKFMLINLDFNLILKIIINYLNKFNQQIILKIYYLYD